jgi:hypothetical protein
MAASRDDWKTTALPAARKAIPFDRHYSATEFERIKEGLVPGSMDDKWFVFYEEPWLYFHRSWTGYCVYQVRFESAGEDARVAEVLVSREPEQYRETDDSRDAQLLTVLLDGRAGRETRAAWEQFLRHLRSGGGRIEPPSEVGKKGTEFDSN